MISTPTNVKVLGAPEFALLKPNSVLVQASLGTPFDRKAFLQWISTAGGYAIFDQGVGEENLRIYEGLPRVIVAATAFGRTYETSRRLGEKVTASVRAYADGQKEASE